MTGVQTCALPICFPVTIKGVGKEEQEGNYTLQVDCIRGADINGLNGNGKIAAPNRFILEKNDHKLLAPFDLVIEISGGSPTQSTGRMAYITDDVLDRFTHPLICSNFCKAISLRNKDLFYCFAYLWNDLYGIGYRDWETDRKSTRLNSSHRSLSRMPSSA